MRMFEAKWIRMMDRCYKEYHNSYKWYGALGVTVCDEWKDYKGFESWVLSQDYEGKELDKDIINPDNMIYGPEFCRFVDKEVNKLLTSREALRGEFPLGVSKTASGKFRGQINRGGVKIHLGSCDTPHQAHRLWQFSKARHLREVAMKQADYLIRDGLLTRATRIEYDYLHNLETMQV